MVSGSWPGEIYLFRGATKKTLGARETLLGKIEREDGDQYKGYGYSLFQAGAVSPADWDSDGDVDLLVGTIDGKVWLLANEGSAKKAAFGKPALLVDGRATEGAKFTKAGPTAADWDGDGDLDLVVGTETSGILLFRNDGTREKPALSAPSTLLAREGKFAKAYRFKPFVADWNGDDLPDLVFGCCDPGEGKVRKTHGFVWVALRKPREG